MAELFDFAIVGAGIAGASLAAGLAPHGRVLLIEAEDRPGYHATGRSAAFWTMISSPIFSMVSNPTRRPARMTGTVPQ